MAGTNSSLLWVVNSGTYDHVACNMGLFLVFWKIRAGEKKLYVELYESVALDKIGYDIETVKVLIGYFEIVLGLSCLYMKGLYFFVFIFFWKIGTESLYLLSHVYGEVWEFIPNCGLIRHRQSIAAVLKEVIAAVRAGREPKLEVMRGPA